MKSTIGARSTAQVWGGTGYCKPNVAERLCRDQHILEVYERTSEIQRVMIAKSIQPVMAARIALDAHQGALP